MRAQFEVIDSSYARPHDHVQVRSVTVYQNGASLFNVLAPADSPLWDNFAAALLHVLQWAPQ